jgi:hypothetical protein
VLTNAAARGMTVVLGPHNFARRTIGGVDYIIGSAQVPYSAFTDFWHTGWHSTSRVMPACMPTRWTMSRTTQAASGSQVARRQALMASARPTCLPPSSFQATVGPVPGPGSLRAMTP